MRSIKRAHVMIAASTALALAAGGTLASAAAGEKRAAAPAKVADAPYARAAAAVNRDGTLSRQKGIEAVKGVGTGYYCIKVSASGLDVRTAVAQVSLGLDAALNSGVAVARTVRAQCGNDPKSFFVRTAKANARHNEPFIITIA